MVVQEDDSPMEAPSTKQTKNYVVIKNHVRELLPENVSSVLVQSDSKVVDKSLIGKNKGLKRKKTLQTASAFRSGAIDISESDLEELKTVYKKCKLVLRKIESKYGHLLNLEDSDSYENIDNTSEESSCEYCSGSIKKKIIFDENGHQIEQDCNLEKHICLKRIKKSHSVLEAHEPSIQIEYDNTKYTNNISLPDDLQELENILKNDNITSSYRRMVIDKMFITRQEYLNTIRYEKHDIIRQLKENPDEGLDFKGTNLSSLQGYPTKPVEEKEKTSS